VSAFFCLSKGLPMSAEFDSGQDKKFSHIWILVFLTVLFFLANQDRARFGFLSRRLMGDRLDVKREEKNVKVDNAYLLDTDAYNEIVQGGKKYIPFIVLRIQMDQNYVWPQLMRDITGVDVFQYAAEKRWMNTQDDPNVLWLRWWQENREQF